MPRACSGSASYARSRVSRRRSVEAGNEHGSAHGGGFVAPRDDDAPAEHVGEHLRSERAARAASYEDNVRDTEVLPSDRSVRGCRPSRRSDDSSAARAMSPTVCVGPIRRSRSVAHCAHRALAPLGVRRLTTTPPPERRSSAAKPRGRIVQCRSSRGASGACSRSCETLVSAAEDPRRRCALTSGQHG